MACRLVFQDGEIYDYSKVASLWQCPSPSAGGCRGAQRSVMSQFDIDVVIIDRQGNLRLAIFFWKCHPRRSSTRRSCRSSQGFPPVARCALHYGRLHARNGGMDRRECNSVSRPHGTVSCAEEYMRQSALISDGNSGSLFNQTLTINARLVKPSIKSKLIH